MKKIFLVLGAIVLSGCATPPSEVTITFKCDPIGAKLIEHHTGKVFDCPASLSYPVSPAEDARGYAKFDGLTAIWVSGAKTVLNNNSINPDQGTSWVQTIYRDPTAPNAYLDAKYALQLQSLQNQRQLVTTQQQELQLQQEQQQQQQQQNLNATAAALARVLAAQK